MKWSIITDSSCDYILDRQLPENIKLAEVPFIITVGQRDYVDTPDLDVGPMVDDMETCPEASRTSCPSPGAWYELFEEADCVIGVTISANLSGSYASAMTAREMLLDKYPEKKVYILDSKSAGSALAAFVEEAVQRIEAGETFDEIVTALEASRDRMNTIFALASFNNLVKNGRVSKLSGFIAGKLGIWGIGVASPEGTIIVKEKTRGKKKILAAFVDDMRENGFAGGYVIISHCQNQEYAELLRDAVLKNWPNSTVKFLPTGGLCSFYAERRGMIVCY